MPSVTRSLAAVLLLFTAARVFGDEVLFEDRFERGISDKGQIVGLEKTDYRVRDGGLEVRVHRGNLIDDSPMLKVVLPFTVNDTVVASVKVTVLDKFTGDGEFAGVYLIDETGLEFGAKKQRKNDLLVFAPGNYIFEGRPGEEEMQRNTRSSTPPSQRRLGRCGSSRARRTRTFKLVLPTRAGI